jgi:hypothetical protein
VPFLRLTRDRRGIENTFLLHADHSGGRPRVLYWYRTAPGIALGRPPLDEEAIHTIEDNHPDIDFDWPAILALSEVMTPEEEVAPARQKRKPPRREREERPEAPPRPQPAAEDAPIRAVPSSEPIPAAADEETTPHAPGLLEELVGREIATRLRARYAEIRTLIYEREVDPTVRERRLRDALPLDPDGWSTAEAVLEGVRSADGLFERLRGELLGS